MDIYGDPLASSTLGPQVHKIFNNEMYVGPKHHVPLEGIELSGYGASMFSHWHDEHATVASVSQALFDVLVGRTAREVVQVRSILYPFGVRVVRTITLTRAANGYVHRSNSGWRSRERRQVRFQLLDRIRTQRRAARAEPVRHPSRADQLHLRRPRDPRHPRRPSVHDIPVPL